jgi:hypothetical protein
MQPPSSCVDRDPEHHRTLGRPTKPKATKWLIRSSRVFAMVSFGEYSWAQEGKPRALARPPRTSSPPGDVNRERNDEAGDDSHHK